MQAVDEPAETTLGYPNVVGPALCGDCSGWLKVCALLRNQLMHALFGNGAPKAGKGNKGGKSKPSTALPPPEDPWAAYREQNGMSMPPKPAQVSSASGANLQKWSRLLPVEVFTAADSQVELPILAQSDFGEKGLRGVICIDLSELAAALSVSSPHPLALLVGGSLRRQREKAGQVLHRAAEFTGLFRDPQNGREFEKTFCIFNLGGKDVVMRRRQAEVAFADSTMLDLLLKVVPAPTSSWNAAQAVEDKPREGFTQVLRQRLGIQGQVQKVMPKRTTNQVHTAVVQVPAEEAEAILKRSGQHGVFLQRFANEATDDCTVVPWCHREIADVDLIYAKASSLPGFMGLMLLRLRVAGGFFNSELKAARLDSGYSRPANQATLAGQELPKRRRQVHCQDAFGLGLECHSAAEGCKQGWRQGSVALRLRGPPAGFQDVPQGPNQTRNQASVVGCLERGFRSGSTSTGVACPAEADCPADCASFAKHSRSGQRRPQAVRGPSAGGPGPEARSRDDSSQAGGVAGKPPGHGGQPEGRCAGGFGPVGRRRSSGGACNCHIACDHERLEGMLPERPRKRPGQDNPDEQL